MQRIVLIFLLMIAFCPSAEAAYKCQRNFRVGMIQNEPLYFMDKDRVSRGIMVDFIADLSKRTGCGFTTVELSRPSIIERLRTSALDLTVLSIKSAALDRVGKFIPAFYSYRALILAPELQKKGYDIKAVLKDKSVIMGNIIGTQAYYQTGELETLRAQSRIREFPEYAGLFKALKRGQVKALIGSVFISDYFLQKEKMSDFGFQIDHDVITPVGTYFAAGRLNADEIKLFEEAFAAMVADGSVARIYGKFVSPLAIKNAIIPIKKP